MSPISSTVVNATYGWYTWDITEAVQQARVRGDDVVSLLFRDTTDPSNSNVYFATSEYSQNQFSPRLNMIYLQWKYMDSRRCLFVESDYWYSNHDVEFKRFVTHSS